MKCKLGVECAHSSNLPLTFEINHPSFIHVLESIDCTNAGTQEQPQKDESPTQGKEVLPVNN